MGLSLSEFFTQERGIRPEILSTFGVSFTDASTAVLPYPDGGEKTRRHLPDGTRRFFFTPGKAPGLFFSSDSANRKIVFLVEGESDTMRLTQELLETDTNAGVVGISGINTWRPELAAHPVLATAEQVLVILDNDADYNVAARVDAAWTQIRADLGKKARRIRLPNGVKDLCEFFQGYDLDALRSLTVRRVSQSRYRPLDLSKAPPPVDWLLDNLIAREQATVLLGDGGLGKSWITMGLTAALVLGHEEFLGRKVGAHGNVLYVDDENPEGVVRRRLSKLGIKDSPPTLRFLSNQSIRLDRKADEFLEEALEFDPVLIVLDSLTRIHTEDENNAAAMSKLYNDGIKPLARETGAAVVVIHHTNKAGGARGSVDIVNAMDAGLSVTPVSEALRVSCFRSRDVPTGETFTMAIRDHEDGSVYLEAGVIPDPPF